MPHKSAVSVSGTCAVRPSAPGAGAAASVPSQSPPADDDGVRPGQWSRVYLSIVQGDTFGSGVAFEVNGWVTSNSVTPIHFKTDDSGLRIGRAADGTGGFNGYISGIRTHQAVSINRHTISGTPDLSLPFPILPRYRS